MEAASPVLIEKLKSAVTDGSGQYRIVDLRPGTYTITFTLTGFGTVKREDFVLPGEFVATVNAELKVGALEETVTVSGESPLVDVQSTKKQQTLDSAMITSLPTARGYAAVMLLIPSMVVSGGAATNVQLSPGMIVFGGRGGRGNEGQSQIDGLGTGAAINGGGVSGYGQLETAQEVVMTAGGGMGEAEVGGPYVNFIPKTGGNTFQNHFYGSGMSGWMQSSNTTDALKAAGLTTPQSTLYLADISLSNGGPIVKDRLWFFYNTQYTGERELAPRHLLQPERRRPDQVALRAGFDPSSREWQFPGHDQADAAPHGTGHAPQQAEHVLGPEHLPVQRPPADRRDQRSRPPARRKPARSRVAPASSKGNYGRMEQIRWTSATTNRLLLEAGLGTYQQNWNGREVPGNNRDLIPVTEQCTAGCPNNGNIQGLTYRAQNWNSDFMEPIRWNASASYVTGAHSFKVGYIGAFYWNQSKPSTNNSDLAYRFNNGVPNQLTESLAPYVADTRVRMNALYLQDQWTRGKLTLQGALRYDHAWSYYPAQQLGPTVFLPTPILFPETQGVLGYNDIDPRFGVAYDLFGNGKTALKFNAGRYLEVAVAGNGNYGSLLPSSRIPTTVTRSWTDANKDFNPDCNLQLPTANGECGAISNLNFGVANAPPSLSFDPAILQGWYTRPSDWLIGATLQQELLPRVSLSVGYTRRWLHNFTVTDNLAVASSDYTPFSITAPLDPRLPGGGGYVISGCTTSTPTSSARSTTTAPMRPTTGPSRRCITASTSTSRRAWRTASSCRPARPAASA